MKPRVLQHSLRAGWALALVACAPPSGEKDCVSGGCDVAEAEAAVEASDLDITMTGDLDGDGEEELIVWRTSDRKWFARRRDGTRVFPAGSEPVWGRPDDKPLVGDLDGDGEDEMIVWRPSDRRWYALRRGGTRVFPQGSEPEWGLPGDVPMIGDLDGDGEDEMVVWRSTNRRWYALRSNGTRVFPKGAEPSLGAAGDHLMLGDLDGDGADEMVAWRADDGSVDGTDDGTWYALRRDGTRVWPSGSEPLWGRYGDVPMLGDLDADGDDEIAVWRPSNGKWYAKRAIGLTRIWAAGAEPTFGVAGDHPRIAQMSGGNEDLVIYRPSSSQWWAETTAGGSLFSGVGWGRPSAPARIVTFESDDDLADAGTPGGNVFVARLARKKLSEFDGWWLRLDVLIENTGTAPITVTSFDVSTNLTPPENRALTEPAVIPGGATQSILLERGISRYDGKCRPS